MYNCVMCGKISTGYASICCSNYSDCKHREYVWLCTNCSLYHKFDTWKCLGCNRDEKINNVLKEV